MGAFCKKVVRSCAVHVTLMMLDAFFEVIKHTTMSSAHAGSWKSHDRDRGRNKRSHDNGADSKDYASSSRYQRTITEEEKKDFVSYQKGE